MSEPSPPARYILRSHSSGLTVLFIFLDKERISFEDGSERVVSTSTHTSCPISSRKAHNDGLQESGENFITEGRDTKLHVWLCVEELPVIGRSELYLNRPPILDGCRCPGLSLVFVNALAAEQQHNRLVIQGSIQRDSTCTPKFRGMAVLFPGTDSYSCSRR
ncbi:hypothetical protein ARMSODRAFT_1027646 [Armillaria solidipes]|uniref:Uncharacterized protein n=1 Tax=Armillaria solidipes TaxID=1076256 RepID=A0A2H3AZG4_9AGAR|nr:hypothetical protein ARMSODRAFT_1027646 [Armillaria solidipes]